MNRSIKRLVLAAVAAAVLCVGPVSSAVAAVPAMWTPQGEGMKQAGSLVFNSTGLPPVTCQIKSEGSTSESFFATSMTQQHQCNSGHKVVLSLVQLGEKEGTSYRVFIGNTPFEGTSPWGGFWKQQSVTVPFTNGSGTKMSTIQFSSTKLGTLYGNPVTATGTLTATTVLGGLKTLK